MELWIRSQDKYTLMKIEEIQICENPDRTWFMNAGIVLGKYSTKERALEILDEIQSKLKGIFLMKMKDEKYSKYIEDGKKYLENLNGIGIVTGDACFDIEPITKDIYVYEMPKE